MKKSKLLTFVALFVIFSFSLQLVACSGITPSGENNYYVSVYKVQREQNENGKISQTSIKLAEQFMVVRSAAFKLDFVNEKNSYEIVVGEGEVLSFENEVQVIPQSDMTIFVREGKKKTINLYVDGVSIKETGDELFDDDYNNLLVDTYEESFDLNQLIFNYLKTVRHDELPSTGAWVIDCKFYAHTPTEIVQEEDNGAVSEKTESSESENTENNSGEETSANEKTYDLTGGKKYFATGRIRMDNGVLSATTDYRCVIELIKSTDVSIVVSGPKLIV